MSDNNTHTFEDKNNTQVLMNSLLQREVMPKIYVEPCQTEFFYEKFKQSYPMFKNPRGLCLIVNIYQIDGMPPRRWSNRDTSSLEQLFEQLLFTVKTYTDSTHDLNSQNFLSILREFSQLPEHQDAQSCIICLMSHGEEGYLTTKEGDKILLDEIFKLFNNINCPNLAGKPKLFFIQSCRDDPISGPAEDLGIRLSFNLNENDQNQHTDESDGGLCFQSDNNLAYKSKMSDNISSNNEPIVPSSPTLDNQQLKQIICHIPTLCDVLVGYPTQKGYIAYRKPEVGSWYMNAIVQVFSKHACDTDICALLNMVNSLISNEVTNTGKKQMSEYTSKLTKPYYYFFPGLASEAAETSQTEIISDKSVEEGEEDLDYSMPVNKKKRLDILVDNEASLFENHLIKNSSLNIFASNYQNILGCDQSDSSRGSNEISNLHSGHLKFIAFNANSFWKPIAREMRIFNESQILEIERNTSLSTMSQKLGLVLQLWLNKEMRKHSENSENVNRRILKLEDLTKILKACRLNKISEELLLQRI